MTRVQEYRLRVFEAAFIEPSTRFFNDQPGLALRMDRWFDGSQDTIPAGDSPSSLGLLRSCLLAEAGNWVTVGRRLEYFPEAAKVTLDVEGLRLENHRRKLEAAFLGESDFESKHDMGIRDGDEFGYSLLGMIEDLTDERMEYLRLMMFATNGEWEARLKRAQTLAENVALRPDAAVPPEVIQDVAWMFYGPEDEPAQMSNALSERPSAWRTRVGSRGWDRTEYSRLLSFSECRKLFEIAAQTISVDENATVAVQQRNALDRLTLALQNSAPTEQQKLLGRNILPAQPVVIRETSEPLKYKKAGESDETLSW